MVFRLEAELLRRLDSRYDEVVPFDWADGVGLVFLDDDKAFMVAEAGSFGGGMDSCRTPFCFLSSCGGWFPPALDALRFQDKLSFLRSELIEDGVGGSSGLMGGGDFDASAGVILAAGARGPKGFGSGVTSKALVYRGSV